jgi:hypothetical protein
VSAFDLKSSQARAEARLGLGTLPVSSQKSSTSQAMPPTFAVATLPKEVRECLYNLEPESRAGLAVPADQLAFYCFNYGGPRAISYAAGLPKLSLERALHRPGFRPKSRALLAAVLKFREDE